MRRALTITAESRLGRIRRRSAAAALLAVLTLSATAAAQPAISGDGPWVLRARGWTDATLTALGTRFEHFAVLPEKGFLLVQAEDRADLAFLSQSGLSLAVDEERTATLRRLEAALARGERLSSIPGFECYRTVEETLATGAALAAAYPELATWIDAGDSWEKIHLPPAGFDLQVLRLTSAALPGDKPALLLTGAVHAREYATAELVTRFAEALLAGYGTDPDATWILDHHEVHQLLVTNPDGRKRAETGLSWRKNADDDFCTGSNSRGIDLNRNFDFEWGCCGGSSSSECDTTFRGPAAASEPETLAVQGYMSAIFPDQRPDDLTTPAPLDAEGIYIDVHAFGQVVLSSWGFTAADPPNAQGILTLARKLGYFPGYAAQLGSTGTVDGSTKDFAYGRLGVPGYTLELGTAFFEQCPFFETAILPGNLAGLLHTAKNVRTPYVTPAGPDAVAPAVPPVAVAPGDLVALTATIDDTRYSGPEPAQAIAAAEVYLDVPPWQGGAPIPLAAADGTFDEAVEAVQATLDTNGLAPGRHTLFVRGQDTAGTFGAVSATFLFVVDPALSPTLTGTVRDAGSGAPLAAEVALGPFRVPTDPATGVYFLQLPSGTYEVSVHAAGYAPAIVADLELTPLAAATLDFRLQPLRTVFFDDIEAGELGWTAEPPWAITTEAAHSPTHSWTDSPGVNYGNNADTSLTSPVFDLTGQQGTLLTFRHIYDFETGFDLGLVEVSTDGSSWTPVRSFSGEDQTAEWLLEEIPLPALDGAATARVRFRVDSDGGLTRDGWHLDDIHLEAASAAGIFADGFESGDTSAW